MGREHDNPDDPSLRTLLKAVQSIAVVGIKAGAEDDAFHVPRYMQAQGYRIVPVNPRLDHVLGEAAVPTLAEISEPVDLVNLFRAIPHIPTHVDEILALPNPPRAAWMQLGIRHEAAARRLRRAGITVVQNLCLRVEHGRLLGGDLGGDPGGPHGRPPGRGLRTT